MKKLFTIISKQKQVLITIIKEAQKDNFIVSDIPEEHKISDMDDEWEVKEQIEKEFKDWHIEWSESLEEPLEEIKVVDSEENK